MRSLRDHPAPHCRLRRVPTRFSHGLFLVLPFTLRLPLRPFDKPVLSVLRLRRSRGGACPELVEGLRTNGIRGQGKRKTVRAERSCDSSGVEAHGAILGVQSSRPTTRYTVIFCSFPFKLTSPILC